MSDELEYLQPDFDPSTLKVAQLRNIFVQHDIAYPSGAKKGELVQLFEDRLRPKAKRLLAQAARVRRTSMGIENIANTDESTVDEELEERPTQPTPMRRAARKSATPAALPRSKSGRGSTKPVPPEDVEDEATTAWTDRTPAARPDRRSIKTPAETEDRLRLGRRKIRLSDFDPASQVKEEAADDYVAPVSETPFTTDNPFQSGSSPVDPGTARRKGTNRKSQNRRRTTDQVVRLQQDDDPAPAPKPRRSGGILSRFGRQKVTESSPEPASLEPSEEFTPDEQLSLQLEEEETGRAVLPARKRQSTSTAAKTGPWIVLLTVLLAFGAWWRQEKLVVGFCGLAPSERVGALANANIQLPEWASSLQPTCDICPLHAVCYEGFEARCLQDYVLHQHPLSLWGLIPLAPTCEPDGTRVKKITAFENRIVEELREQNAKSECGLKDESGNTISSSEMNLRGLKAQVRAKAKTLPADAEFDGLWDVAIENILAREEISSIPEQGNSGAISRLSSNSLARLPIGCAVRRSARLALARHWVPISSAALVLVAVAYIHSRILAERKAKARVPGLVSGVLSRLATQAALHENNRSPEPHISAGQLRDDILRDEFSAKRRQQIWDRVQRIVELNANVRAGVKESRSGDVSRVWEWIGAVPVLEDGYERSASRSRSSFGLDELEGSSRRTSYSPGSAVKQEDGAFVRGRWSEGSPAYY